MAVARFQFLAELADFLPREERGKEILVSFQGNPEVKHLVEALGVPHTEVQRVESAGEVISLRTLAHDRDSFRVFPASLSPHGNLHPPGTPRFVLDVHLGRLCAYLRMLGFDCLYRNDASDEQLAQLAHDQQRILFTRDRRLLMRSLVQYGYCLRSLDPGEQLVEVLRRYHLAGEAATQRCLRCNGLLEPVPKQAVLDRIEPLTRKYYEEFHRCRDCAQVYWKGSHYWHMQAFLSNAMRQANSQPAETGWQSAEAQGGEGML